MAALGSSRGDRHGNSSQNKSPLTSPEKIRELLNEGVSAADTGTHWWVEKATLIRILRLSYAAFWLIFRANLDAWQLWNTVRSTKRGVSQI